MNLIRKSIIVFACVGYALFNIIFSLVEGPARGAANAQQMNDSAVGYAVSQSVSNMPWKWMAFLIFAAIILTCFLYRRNNNKV